MDAKVYFCTPGSVTQSEVQQSDTFITTSEGRGVQMNCSYTFLSIGSLQWYRQHGSRAPQLIVLKAVSGQEQSGNSAMILNEEDKWSRLDINETQNPDSAVYYCAVRHSKAETTPPLTTSAMCWLEVTLHTLKNRRHTLKRNLVQFRNPLQCALRAIILLSLAGVIAQEEVLQSPRSLKVSEGVQTTLSCSYKTSNFYSLQWYRQYPQKRTCADHTPCIRGIAEQ
ncbi:UNVERIFIED_CONTAM: hypothetical protein FKN15_039238 [Acipenser sinensis]